MLSLFQKEMISSKKFQKLVVLCCELHSTYGPPGVHVPPFENHWSKPKFFGFTRLKTNFFKHLNYFWFLQSGASSDSQTDSGISSASSVSSDVKEVKSTESLPPPNDNIKRYFHTIRSTPLPKSKSCFALGS